MGKPYDPERPMLDAVTLSPETTHHGLESPVRSTVRVGSMVVIAGAPADVGSHLRVDTDAIIGRIGADLVLRDARISRRHARIFHEEEDWWVEDLASTNGTSIDAGMDTPLVRIPGRATLRDGARVYVGSTVVKFSLIDETEAAYLDEISRLAATDPLTGLHATHRFDSLLEEAVRVAQLTATPLALLMMDLDGLKQINDRHGHRYGAHTIATVGKMLREGLRGHGEACRFGGDEFCAYLPGSDLARAERFAEAFRARVEDAAIELDGVVVRVTISIGIAVGVAPRVPKDLTVPADEALYRAKGAGRNQVST